MSALQASTRALVCAWLLLCFVGCQEGPPATEVLVVVDGTRSTGAALVRLQVRVFAGRDVDGAVQMRDFEVGPDTHPLPVSFSIAASTQSASYEFRLVVTGYDRDNRAIVEQQAITRFAPNRAGRLDLFLYAGCASLCRAEGALSNVTCSAEGECVPIPVRSELPEATGSDLGGYAMTTMMPDGSLMDAGNAANSDSEAATGSSEAATDSPEGSTGSTPGQGDAGGSLPGAPSDGGSDAARDASASASDAGATDSGSKLDAALDAGDAGRDAQADAAGPSDAAVDSSPFNAAPTIPDAGTCPSFVSGTISVMGMDVQIAAGAKAAGPTAPLLFYWHSTGGSPSEYLTLLPAAIRDEITNAGGIIVAPGTTLGGGTDLSVMGVWSTSDLTPADAIVACAVRDHNVDPRRIYMTGCSAGGMAVGALDFQRAGYLAAVSFNSGGLNDVGLAQLQTGAARPAPLLAMHGAANSEVIGFSYFDAAARACTEVKARGGFAVRCDHGGGHCGAPAALQVAAWQFMKDHRYGLAQRPYAGGLPASFPSYCTIVP